MGAQRQLETWLAQHPFEQVTQIAAAPADWLIADAVVVLTAAVAADLLLVVSSASQAAEMLSAAAVAVCIVMGKGLMLVSRAPCLLLTPA